MLPQEKPPNTLESQLVPLEGGTKKAKSNQLEHDRKLFKLKLPR